MCRDCGCEEANHAHHPDHEHWVDGKLVRHNHAHRRTLTLEETVLAKNDRIATENRSWFLRNGISVLNLISSPGSGKTYLLEKTLQKLDSKFDISILTGDQEHDYDAERLKRASKSSRTQVKQLNTRSACHLDASMIQRELGGFVRPEPHLLIIENVGNLVCPAAFDLGEAMKVALLSCTEGEDKPSKYPLLFSEANLILLTKMDLAPHLDWSLAGCEEHIRKVNPAAPIFHVSARAETGLDSWLGFLKASMRDEIA